MYLINLDTGGNQATIFATNKLRNVVGTSELIYRVGTSYVTRALDAIEANYWPNDKDDKNDKEKKIKAIEEHPELDFEIVISTSGKALLLARTKEKAKEFIAAWSSIVVTEAPGIDAVAVCSNTPVNLELPLTDTSKNSYMQVYRETERLMTFQRMNEGRPLARFQRLPIVAECAFSGLPAAEREQGQPVSAVVKAQQDASRDDTIKKRMKALFPENASVQKILDGLDSLEEQDWLAVIHADANGLGQLVINFADHVKALVGNSATGRDYVNYYREFSTALDEISRTAFKSSVFERWCEDKPLIVPIVVGGDDLTVVMDGRESLEFAKRFMTEFGTMTREHPKTSPILGKPDFRGLECARGSPSQSRISPSRSPTTSRRA